MPGTWTVQPSRWWMPRWGQPAQHAALLGVSSRLALPQLPCCTSSGMVHLAPLPGRATCMLLLHHQQAPFHLCTHIATCL
jgi:hypothetical protein